MLIRSFLLTALLVASTAVADELATGSSTFVFDDWAGAAIDVRVYVPEQDAESAPIVFVMHGASRDVERYFNDWAPFAEEYGFVVVVPEFTVEAFSGSARYNLGCVFDPESGELRPQEHWTFSAIEPLFDEVVEGVGGSQQSYTLYGHSAGSQFVHRFLYYMPDARVNHYIAANAGWYAMPLLGVEYPYGLGNAAVDAERLPAIFAADLVILLGRDDDDPRADKLRHAPEAELQGGHRLARGITMYRVARAAAERAGLPFNWRIGIVDEADHDNAKMAPAAVRIILSDSD